MARREFWFDAPAVRTARVVIGVVAVGTVVANMFIVASLPGGLDVVEYFSFFTNLTNVLAGAAFVVSGSLPRRRLPDWWDTVRGGIALYLALTGLVFAVLLAGLPTAGVITPWVNTVVHELMPVLAVLDWLIVPAIGRAPWWRPLVWLCYPVLYLAYTLARGALVGWYPYPFLDPTLAGGYVRLLSSTGVVVLGFLVGAVLLDLLGRARVRTRSRGRR